MSSHHIVREKQEPALLVLGLDNFSDELLGQLLEWSPTVIVTEPMAEKLNAYGIKIDWIITDSGEEDIQSDVKQLPLKQGSVISTAFDFLTGSNYSAVNVVTDDLQLPDYLPFLDKINLVIFYNHQKIYTITSGFSKWKPAGEFIELLNQPDNLQLSGLETVKDRLFKTAADGLFVIRFDGPFLFIAEDI
ncbi:MAG TPA: thiamine diphosphokinase [Mucilaginibacter sp.]